MEEEFLGIGNMKSLLDSSLLKNNFGDVCESYYGFRSKSGKSVDPRVIRLFEFFRQLYHRGLEVFKNMVPTKHHEEFEEMFERIGSMLDGLKTKQIAKMRLQRSLSVGSPRARGFDESSELKLERFKVRTITADGGDQAGGPGGQGGGGGQSQTGSASK